MNSSSLIGLVDNFPECRVAVIGDSMLDRYLWGQVSRISQEAPVPIVHVDHRTEIPGGAANVAANITALGGQVVLFSVIGRDPDGNLLESLLRKRRIETSGIHFSKDRHTTVKTRIIGNRQQVVRVDSEETKGISKEERQIITDKLLQGIAQGDFQGIVFEDYAKGLLEPDMIRQILDLANRHSVFTVLDPHPKHAFNVAGLQAMTPNRAEAFGLTGYYFQEGVLPLNKDNPLKKVGRKLLRTWQVENLLITLGANGMALFTPDGNVKHISTRAREVFDVSGAGDTVTASFILSILAGAEPWEAANLANHASGLVVAKIGTAPVNASELRQNLEAGNE